MIMHRPLPEKGRVKRVTVNKRCIGTRTEWTADFVVDVSKVRQEQNPVKGTIAIDIGWRQLEEGPIRVAAWDANDGETGCLELSPELISSLRYDRVLRSIRKKNFKRIIRKLVTHFHKNTMPAWMRREMSQTGDTPTPAKARATLAQWESAERLARLAKKCRENEVKPKHQDRYKRVEKCCRDFPLLYSWEHKSIYEELEKWRYHDFHLYSWEQDQRTKSRRRRKDLYRNFAAQLSRKYKVLIIEDFNLSQVARKSGVDEKADIHVAKANQHLASVHELRDCLVNAFSRCGEIIEIDPRDSTRICYECGMINTWDQAAELVHRCEGCGEVWDQDYNAARILRRRGERERCGGANNPGATRNGKNNGKRPSRSFREMHKQGQAETARTEVRK
jgi:transposase